MPGFQWREAESDLTLDLQVIQVCRSSNPVCRTAKSR
jgi:hypothetical protein